MQKSDGRIRQFFQNKSFLFRFFVSYVCILLIPIVTIFVTYFTSLSNMRREVLKNNQIALSRIFDVFDEQLLAVSHTATQAGTNGQIILALYSDRSNIKPGPYLRHQVSQYLNTLNQNNVYDVFIYFRNTDTVISGPKASADSLSYFNYYYASDDQSGKNSYADWKSMLSATSFQSLADLYTKDGKHMLAFLQTLPEGNVQNSNAVICFVLTPAYIDSLEITVKETGGAFLLMNSSGSSLISSDARFTATVPEALRGKADLTYANISGEKCVVQPFRSKVLACTYYSITPETVFWSQLSTLRMVCIFSIGLCIVVSILLAVAFAKHNYHPVFSLAAEVSHYVKLPYNKSKENEAEFVHNAVAHIVSEKDDLSRRLELGGSKIRDEFLLQTLQGVVSDKGSWSSAFLQHGITPISDRFCVILIRLESWDEKISGDMDVPESKQMATFLLQNVLGEIFTNERHQCFILYLERKRYAAVANLREDADRGEIRELCEQTRNALSDHLSLHCSFCVGQCRRELSGICASYQDSLNVLDYLFVLGINKTVMEEEIGERSFEYNVDFISSAERKILLFLQSENPDEDVNLITEDIITSAVSEQRSSLDVIKSFQYDTVSLLNRISAIKTNDNSAKKGSLIRPLISAKTFEQFKVQLKSALLTLWRQSSEPEHSSSPAIHIRSYIDRHFTEPQLNVNMLGEFIGLSPSYASKIFRSFYGVSLLEYLSKTRISYAKNLLLTTKETIDEISTHCGFLSSSVFIRTFKREEGITPGNFRCSQADRLSPPKEK